MDATVAHLSLGETNINDEIAAIAQITDKEPVIGDSPIDSVTGSAISNEILSVENQSNNFVSTLQIEVDEASNIQSGIDSISELNSINTSTINQEFTDEADFNPMIENINELDKSDTDIFVDVNQDDSPSSVKSSPIRDNSTVTSSPVKGKETIYIRPKDQNWIMGEDWEIQVPLDLTVRGLMKYIEYYRHISEHRQVIRLKTGKIIPKEREWWSLKRIGISNRHYLYVEPTRVGGWLWNDIKYYHNKLIQEVLTIIENHKGGIILLNELNTLIKCPPPIRISLRVFLRKYPEYFAFFIEDNNGKIWIEKSNIKEFRIPEYSSFPLGLGTLYPPDADSLNDDFPWEKYADIDGVQRVEVAIDPFTIIYRLSIISAKNLFKFDIFEKKDMYCILYWNGEFLGRTAVRLHSLKPPRFRNDRFKIEVLAETDIGKCNLFIQLFEVVKNGGGEDYCVSCVDMTGTILKDLFCSGKSVTKEIDLVPNKPNKIKKDDKKDGDEEVVEKKSKGGGRFANSKGRSSLVTGCLEINGGPAGHEIGVISARNLAKVNHYIAGDHFVVVLWVDNDIGHTEVIADSVSPVWTSDEVFSVKVPQGLSMEECMLELQVWSMQQKDKTKRGDFNGSVRITGSELTTLLTGSDPWACRIERPLAKTLALPKEVQQDALIQGFLTIVGGPAGLFERDVKEFEVQVVSASGLGKAASAFCTIYWGYEMIGKSVSAKKSNEVIWNEQKFKITCAYDMDLATDALMKIELFDMGTLGVGDFLGCAVIEGSEIIKLLCSTYATTRSYELKKDPEKDEKKQKYVKGTLTLRGGSWGARAAEERTIVIHACKGLATIGNGPQAIPNTYCVVIFNGIKIGKTSTFINSIDPYWLDAWFHIQLPVTSFMSCKLEIEVWANIGNSTYFLGCVTLEGIQLSFLEAQVSTDLKHDLSTNDSIPARQRVPIQGEIWFGSPGISSASQLIAEATHEEQSTDNLATRVVNVGDAAESLQSLTEADEDILKGLLEDYDA